MVVTPPGAMIAAAALAAAIALSGLHLVSAFVVHRLPRQRRALASFAGGVGLAYVFLYLLFQLAKEGAPVMHARFPIGPAPLETLFLVLLAAFAGFYLLTTTSARAERTYRLDAGLYTGYNCLVGVGLVEQALEGALPLALYTVALGLHLMFNDQFLRHLCPGLHRGGALLALAAAPVVGCALALWLAPPLSVLYTLLAVVAGATMLNVVREELPGPEALHPGAFALGIGLYGLLILSTWRF